MTKLAQCSNCFESEMSLFYELNQVPVHSVVLLKSREQALAYPKGDIALAFCPNCSFISNTRFDASLHNYALDYESTQSFSQTFDAFAHRVAQDLVSRYKLYGKTILEIGCGQGEFLRLICDLGRNWGLGFDPAYVQPESDSTDKSKVEIIKDEYSEVYADREADFIICKMTLEHIQNPYEFVRMVRRAIGDRSNTTVFFQVPDVSRILRELAFWDIYYEHCSYFSPASLESLFRDSGFDILRLTREYGDQYILLEAKPNGGTVADKFDIDVHKLERDVDFFTTHAKRKIQEWPQSISEGRGQGKRYVLWGGGSKAVAFLTTLGIVEEIEYVADINPNKENTYIAGTGQQIVSPEFLRKYKPYRVIVMNPIYMSEIGQELIRLGLEAELISV